MAKIQLENPFKMDGNCVKIIRELMAISSQFIGGGGGRGGREIPEHSLYCINEV